MDCHLSKRRPHGFLKDLPEQIPDHGTLTSPFQPNFTTYSLAPPQSSTFSYPSTTSHPSYASDGQALATSVTFDGAPPQHPVSYNQQYHQQQHQAFYEQPPFFSHYDTLSDIRHQSYYSSPTSRKRQRSDSDMHFPFFSRPAAGHDDREKPSSSDIADGNMNNPGSTMFETFCCPWSGYDTPAGYTFIPSSSMYDSSALPTYPTALGSASHHPISQNQVIADSGPEQNGLFLIPADPHANQQLQEKFPPLQPGTYLSTLPPPGQEPMSYQSFQQDDPKSETTSAFVKSEVPEEKFQPADYRTGPSTSLGGAIGYTAAAAAAATDSKASLGHNHNHELVRYPATYQEPLNYQSFKVQQECSKPDVTAGFLKSERPEPEYQNVDYNGTESNAPFSVATDYEVVGETGPKAGSYHDHDLVRYSAPHMYPTSHDYGPQETVGAEHAGFFQLDSHGNPMDLVISPQKPPATRRGPFKDQSKRAKTAQVRKIGSCIRCRMQRIRCEFDPESPDDKNAPCDGCKKIIANSKVHRMPCKRWKLTDIKLSKPGQVDEPDLKWTHRWQDSATLPEITQWASAEVRNILLTDGYGKAITVKVRRFKELPSDKRERFIRHDDGTEETIPTEPFGLVDVEAVKSEYERYLRSGRVHICKALCGPREKLLWKTYQLAWERRDSLPKTTSSDEIDLLSRTLELWVAVRLTTKSFEITGGETLGIPPDRTGKVVLPPVMGAQLDKIIIDHILPKLRRETLELLQAMTQQKKTKTWMTTYLVTFMLLHNVALITKHDRDYAQKHKMKEKFGKEWARAEMVKEYHLGANILLAYFHYCNKGLYPFSQDCKDSDLINLAELDKPSLEFVKRTRMYVEDHRHNWEDLRHSNNPNVYGNDYYFISQLFEQDWLPRDTTIIG